MKNVRQCTRVHKGGNEIKQEARQYHLWVKMFCFEHSNKSKNEIQPIIALFNSDIYLLTFLYFSVVPKKQMCKVTGVRKVKTCESENQIINQRM